MTDAAKESGTACYAGALMLQALGQDRTGSAALADARRKLGLWRYDYNNVRPHSSLANQTPAEARRTLEQSNGTAPGAIAAPKPTTINPMDSRHD